MVKKIAIIGAGASGLTALKVCAVEYGYDAWCLEKTHDLGGLWRYKPEECDGEASVMKSTVINTSKEMMAYSDFPPNPKYPNFMHNRDVIDYFRDYAKAFDLEKRIRFNTTVVSVKRTDEYEKTGQWEVIFKNLKTGETNIEIYDAVLACTGHHVEPYTAEIKGLDNGQFKGRVLHSHSYKDPRGYEDKKVVVIGIGNSGGDIAVELSRIAEKVYLVARRGTWVLNRIYDKGYPLDMALTSRFMLSLRHLAPNIAVAFTESRVNARFDHAKYGLKPRHHIFQQHPCVNDELPNRIQCGSIVVKPGVKDFQANNTILFDDGSRVENIDTVIVCTGYSFGFPYLENGKLIPVKENRVQLYKQMIVPDLAHPETLAVIGLIQPLGAIMPISEMQTRFVCELLKDNASVHLPSRSAMWENIAYKTKSMQMKYVESRRHTIQVDYVAYMDELATFIGAKPSPLDYLISDPFLVKALLFGPCLPYQFRLQGPHSWPGARQALVNVWDRVWFPTKAVVGACAEGGRCTCPEDTGCRIRNSVNKAIMWAFAILSMIILVLFLF